MADNKRPTNKTIPTATAVEVTPEQIEAWKEKHGDVYSIECEGKVCYVRRPTRKMLGLAATLSGKDPIKYNEVLLKNVWLGGDDELMNDDAYFLGVSGQLAELIDIKDAELKKL